MPDPPPSPLLDIAKAIDAVALYSGGPVRNFEPVGRDTIVTLLKNGRIHYRDTPKQQSLEDWNEFWSEYKNA